jgi:hypothetical protein
MWVITQRAKNPSYATRLDNIKPFYLPSNAATDLYNNYINKTQHQKNTFGYEIQISELPIPLP